MWLLCEVSGMTSVEDCTMALCHRAWAYFKLSLLHHFLGRDPKGAALWFTGNLALAYASENIRVTYICPGYVESNRTVEVSSDLEGYATLTKCARSAGLENARKSPARFHFWLRMYLSSSPAHR